MQSWQASLVNLALRVTMKQVTNLTASVKYTRLFGQALDTINKPLVTLKSMKITPVKIPDAEFDAEWIDMPSSDGDRVILYLPGGAFIMRTPHIHRGMVSRFCEEANVRALMVYYRLAPENPYPAALNDACAAYRWLLSQGYDAKNIIIAGDSAGGGLTLSTLIRLRDEKEQLPAGGFMISPGVDLSHQSPSRWKNGDKDVVFARPGRFKMPFQLYLAKNQDINDPAV
jgi:monoterpene epsilon-lactone hydrolase